MNTPRYLKTAEAMKLLRFGSKSRWHAFVVREGVPHVRLSARNFVYPEKGLNDWMAKRSNTGAIA